MISFSRLILEDVDRSVKADHLSKDSDKYRVHETFTCDYGEGVIVVPKGYVTDLSSSPWFLWWLYPPGLGYGRKPAVIHDYIYSTLHRRYTKEFADDLFYHGLVTQGMDKWKAKLCYLSVKWFGKGGWD